jgi:dTDP-3-amino-3,4,6-trideoxy-alpha-D-glucose transaminase
MTRIPIPFMNLRLAEEAGEVQAAIARVVASGWYVLGPEVDGFEREFAEACGARHAVGTGNGTDALAIILRALGIGPGDEVITSPLSAAYTALAILMAGAQPVFADIDDERLTLDAEPAERAITPRTAAILPVHLYGQAADMTALAALASRRGLALVEDCCQAHLATCEGTPVGTFGAAGAFSFYPTKNLGALGDGGAIVTGDAGLAARMKRIRNGGQSDRYHHTEPGINSRLDEMQAAILRARLPWLRRRTDQRRALAARYRACLADAPVRVPLEIDAGHVYHLFPVRTTKRSALQAHLRSAGIETLVHYPVPIPRQPAFASAAGGRWPVAEAAADQVLSLPLHPALTAEEVESVAAAIRASADDGEGKELSSCER